jgi:hypothetical protein
MITSKLVVSRRWKEDKIETKVSENRQGIWIEMSADDFKAMFKKELAQMGKVAAIMKQETLDKRIDQAWKICISEMQETTAQTKG